MNRVRLFAGLFGLLILAILAIPSSSSYSERMHFLSEHNHTRLVPLPESLDLAGEVVPLSKEDPQERLSKELLTNTYWHSNTLQILKRSSRYVPDLLRILQEEGIPEDFIYLAIIESGLSPAVSPAGAAGFWQLMPGTAEDLGLEVNGEIDERYHMEKSTRAAAVYLRKAKERFGSWTLAAASYNMGMAGLERQMNRQSETNYYDLLLNEETKRYVFRILALKCIMEKPRAYGFDLDPNEYDAPWNDRLVQVDSSVANWGEWAHQFGWSYNDLKRHNPWLRDAQLSNPSRKTYSISVGNPAN
ncbi:MAG: lytic transglycosylase domain-containing protein [Schleiferiaceae bacterium]|nr:lytic transglycosylase domain-containing protein [Schleiferiaceae bacterium]